MAGVAREDLKDELKAITEETLKCELREVAGQIRNVIREELDKFLRVFEVWAGPGQSRSPTPEPRKARSPSPGRARGEGKPTAATSAASPASAPSPDAQTTSTSAAATRPSSNSSSRRGLPPRMPLLARKKPIFSGMRADSLDESHEWVSRHKRGYVASIDGDSESKSLALARLGKPQAKSSQMKHSASSLGRIQGTEQHRLQPSGSMPVDKTSQRQPCIGDGESDTRSGHVNFNLDDDVVCSGTQALPSAASATEVANGGQEVSEAWAAAPVASDDDGAGVGDAHDAQSEIAALSLTAPMPLPAELPSRSAISDRGDDPMQKPISEIPSDDGTRFKGSFVGIRNSFKTFALPIVDGFYFNYVVGFVVLCNAITVGAQCDHVARHRLETAPMAFRIIELCFCVFFTFEVSLRIFVHGLFYFQMSGWQWNVFDVVLVLCQISEVVMSLSELGALRLSFSFMRILRVLRIIRVVRTIRVLRLITELRTLATSILSSIRCLIWTVALLMLVIFVVGVWLTELTSYSHRYWNDENYDHAELDRFFGTLGASIFCLFQAITGGVDWREAVTPLMDNIHPVLAVFFAFYIAFSLLAVMNIVTGVFVESALLSAKEDKDYYIVNNVRELFGGPDGQMGGVLTWDDFRRELNKPQMQEYFKAIDVDPSEAMGLFRLLDLDDSGSIDAEEFLNGCIRLHGPAKALDLALLMHEVRRISFRFDSHAKYVTRHIGYSWESSTSLASRNPGSQMSAGSTTGTLNSKDSENRDPTASSKVDMVEVPFAPHHEENSNAE